MINFKSSLKLNEKSGCCSLQKLKEGEREEKKHAQDNGYTHG